MYLHTKYCSDIKELHEFLRKLEPSEFITMTEKHGYTIVWKSRERYDLRD